MTAKAIPEGYHTLTPYMTVRDATRAVEFYKQAFGAVEKGVMKSPDGKIMHAELRIGDSLFMLADEFPEMNVKGPQSLEGTSVSFLIYVEDVDAFTAQAVGAGAKVTMPVADMFWGDRYGQIEDPFGHRWSVATHVKDKSLEEIQQAMPKMNCPSA